MYKIKKILYALFVNNRVIRFIDAPAISLIIPSIVGLYYGTLDIWGDEWVWIKDHKDTHALIFSILASATILVLFLKGIADTAKGLATKKYEQLLESMINLFNELVKKRKIDFTTKRKTLSPLEMFSK